jgi:predicted naringenin-chalcone synthase
MLIRGLGHCVPPHRIAQETAAVLARSFQGGQAKASNAVDALYRRAGVQFRHSVVLDSSTNGEAERQSFYPAATSAGDRGPTLSDRMRRYEQAAGELAVGAARQALDRARAAPQEVTHLITVSCTGFAAPGFDLELYRELPLSPAVARTHIGFMGCHAMLNALRVAHTMCQADAAAVVLVCAVELCSLHYQYGRRAQYIVANSLFADGAAAAVCSAESPCGNEAWRWLANGSTVIPQTASDMSWKLGDHGFEMSLSPRVPDVIRATLRGWMESWLASQGLSLHEVRRWAVHPGGPRILDAVQEALGLEPHDLTPSRDVLRDYGNMSSATVMFVLERLSALGGEGPCVMVGFGPGLVIETALLV